MTNYDANTANGLLAGGDWWAAVEQQGSPGDLRYMRVIAWERNNLPSGEERLIAWLNSRVPVRSDRFEDEVPGWILNHFELLDATAVASRKTAGRWKEFNWA